MSRRSKVIAAIAFYGIPVDQEMVGETEMPDGAVLIPLTRGNIKLRCAEIMKERLERATSEVHDDASLTARDYQALQQVLEKLRQAAIESSLVPAVREATIADLDIRLSLLLQIQGEDTGDA